MRNERLIAFIIGRCLNGITILGGYLLSLGIDLYPIYGIEIIIIAIFFTIWGILGFIGLFHNKIAGNVVDLIIYLNMGIPGTICLYSSIVWGPIIPVIIGSILIIGSISITFVLDIVVFTDTEKKSEKI
ncbi:MAG: hypothetical protein ACTSPY_14550 [Candidatus Helarchaeota archaeon]